MPDENEIQQIELFVNCNICSKQMEESSNEHIYHERNYYCQDCFDELFLECEECGHIESHSDNFRRGLNDELLCGECYYDRYVICESCGEAFYEDDTVYDEEEDRYYCRNCDSNYNRNNIRQWNYKPHFKFRRLKSEIKSNNLFLGLELEVELGEEGKQLDNSAGHLLDYMKKDDFFYIKDDGSIEGGFEIVTHPFTIQWGHKYGKFYNLLKYLKSDGYLSYDSGRCGLHIHLDQSFFKKREIMKLMVFFNTQHDWIYRFSRRRNVNSYCIKMNYNKENYKYNIKNKIPLNKPDSRYYAVNVHTPHNTVEIRIFRGTLNHKRFLASLQFADAVAHYIKNASITAISDHVHGKQHFMNWVKHANRYNHLVNQLKLSY